MSSSDYVSAIAFRICVGLSIGSASGAMAQTSSSISGLPATATPNTSPAATPEVCFLIQYTSIPIPGGIRGIRPGTPITILEDRGDLLKVKSDGIEFQVRKDRVMTDAQLARRISQTDAHAQQQTAESVAAQKQRILQEQQKQVAEQNQVKVREDELRNLESHYRVLQTLEGELQLKIGQAQQSHPWFNQRGRVIRRQPDQTHAQLPFLQSRLRDVQHDKNEARRRLDEAQRRYPQP